MFFDNTLRGSDNTFEGHGIPLLGGGDDETMGGWWSGILSSTANLFPKQGINWNQIINQGFGIGSQAISAFSGAHGGTQIGYNPSSQSVFAIQQTQPTTNFGATANPYAGMSPAQIQAAQAAIRTSGAGAALGGGLDGIFNWLMANPLIAFGGVAALFLLFKEPPRRKQ